MYNRTTLYLFPLIYNYTYLKRQDVTQKNSGFELNSLYLKDEKKNYQLKKYLFLLLDIDKITSEKFISFMRIIKLHPKYESYYTRRN